MPALQPLDRVAIQGRQHASRWFASWWRLVYLAAVVLVLVLSRRTWRGPARRQLAGAIVQGTLPGLAGFTLLTAMASLIIIRIVVTTAQSYGLTQYAVEAVVRVLVLELLPLVAPVFVALRYAIPGAEALYDRRRAQDEAAGAVPSITTVAADFMPRVVAGVVACATLVAVSCVVCLVLAYLSVYGFSLAGFDEYTRRVGQIFGPAVSLIFVLKTVFFSLVVSLVPLTSALYDAGAQSGRTSVELHGLVRMLAVILLVEVASLVGNYY
jgi:phospholipid/cholesterol/gamma-HCH transport system permease protein